MIWNPKSFDIPLKKSEEDLSLTLARRDLRQCTGRYRHDTLISTIMEQIIVELRLETTNLTMFKGINVSMDESETTIYI